MHYKISYNSIFSTKGTHYNQVINVKMARNEFIAFNHKIAVSMLSKDYKFDCNPLYLDTFKKGVNYTTMTQLKFFASYFYLNTNKRFKSNRNTIINISFI